jgi:hypothetical protein
MALLELLAIDTAGNAAYGQTAVRWASMIAIHSTDQAGFDKGNTLFDIPALSP